MDGDLEAVVGVALYLAFLGPSVRRGAVGLLLLVVEEERDGLLRGELVLLRRELVQQRPGNARHGFPVLLLAALSAAPSLGLLFPPLVRLEALLPRLPLLREGVEVQGGRVVEPRRRVVLAPEPLAFFGPDIW